MSLRLCAIPLLLVACCQAAEPDAAWRHLDRAYQSLKLRDYDMAIDAFREASKVSPSRADIHKNLAYTLLKAGETELAREEFAAAIKLDPKDTHLAREYAFLCFETRQEAEAYRVFKQLRESGDPVATEVFLRLDKELADGIERWSTAVQLGPDIFSGHEELARLAERRGNLTLAADHYLIAWTLRPGERKYLLDLGRVWKQAGRVEQSTAALLAASRGAEPRVAELARALLPTRYPWVYEFRLALDFDRSNMTLRRELAFLLLEMSQKKEAESEFRAVVAADSKDALAIAQLGFLLMGRGAVAEAMPLLEQALAMGDDELKDRVRVALKLPKQLRQRPETTRGDATAEAIRLADKSFAAGYLKDAVRYLRIAHENDPLDFKVIAKLGWTYNLLHDDREAIEWFGLARRSSDPAIAKDADKAWKNLRPEFARVRTSVWMYPMYSSRWSDLFAWAQAKTEFMPNRSIRPYISTRFSGDIRQTTSASNSLTPGWLSESAIIIAGGITTRTFHGIRAWAEAGYAFSYVKQGDMPQIRPDVRGGLSMTRSFGRNLGATRGGLFGETSADILYISRFDRDTIAYSQNRAGYTIRNTGPLQVQLVWNLNLTADTRRFGWANTFEQGPGVRIKIAVFPHPVVLSIDSLSGRYTVLDGTRPPTYSDLRIGLWYAFSR